MARPKKKTLTEEEMKAMSLQRSLDDVLRDFKRINEPSIYYNLGTRVSIGNLDKVIIIASFEDSKYYLVEITRYVHDKYSKEEKIIGENIEHKYFVWHDIDPYKGDLKDVPRLVKQEDVFFSSYNGSVSGIFTMYYHFGLDLNPEYQRGNVWTLEDKVALIDSIFNNVEIGKVALIHNGYGVENIYEVLDGKQRIQTLIDFFENRFTYKGMRFCDLHPADKWHFEDYKLAYCETRDITPKQRLEYFLKINKGGRAVDKKHLEYVESLLNNNQ